jgi:hypothetical protein
MSLLSLYLTVSSEMVSEAVSFPVCSMYQDLANQAVSHILRADQSVLNPVLFYQRVFLGAGSEDLELEFPVHQIFHLIVQVAA